MKKFCFFSLLLWCQLVHAVPNDPNAKVFMINPMKTRLYESVYPPFIVNLQDKGKPVYAQIAVEVKLISSMESRTFLDHRPQVRALLLKLFSSKTKAEIETRVGRESLRRQALGKLKALFSREVDDPLIEDVLFTSFIIQ